MDVRDIAQPRRGVPHDKPALVFHDRCYTYGELAAESARLARGLSHRLAPGELLALWLPNGPELLCLYLACLRSGIVPVPLHRDMAAPEAGAILRSSRARVLIASGSLLGAAQQAIAHDSLERIYVIGAPARAGCHDYEELRCEGGTIAVYRGSDDSTGFVLHTSGSDGRAKGVMLSWRNLNEILDLRLSQTRLGPDSVAVVASCLTQSVGLHQSLALLAAGGTLVLLEGYDIARMADAIHRYRPTHLIMVVNAFDRLLHHPAITAASLASVRFAAVGADRVTRRVQERHIALTGRPLHVSYGMSESSWAILNLEGAAKSASRSAAGARCRDPATSSCSVAATTSRPSRSSRHSSATPALPAAWWPRLPQPRTVPRCRAHSWCAPTRRCAPASCSITCARG
ncbi:MAG: acyl--CoA ligase [Gammaproteobacteria bacterium]|nr:acyl--CoA ligase [Gammaproteobacteria bacterium]